MGDSEGNMKVTPTETNLTFRTQRKPGKTGLMLVGLGGNNGSTITAAVIANRLKMKWETKQGEQSANYFGSITQSSTIRRAQVFEPELQRQLRVHMENITPLPAIFDIDFVATNQTDRADNVLSMSKCEAVEKVRQDIRDFKAAHDLEKVIVLWTANTERFTEIREGTHDTSDNILAALARSEAELAPSGCYAIASILEGCSYINGSPQNTLVPGIVDLAEKHNVFIAGDDFKSGQTKMKSALIEFFVGAGIKPECIASYNHLGNNDGRNLTSPKQFRSKEISKANVVDDMVASNEILFPPGTDKPDHCIVIKYL